MDFGSPGVPDKVRYGQGLAKKTDTAAGLSFMLSR